MIIDHLTERGTMDLASLYESSFTDMNPLGVEGVLGRNRTTAITHIRKDIYRRAA
jgi:type I restriction enzyme, R subunit